MYGMIANLEGQVSQLREEREALIAIVKRLGNGGDEEAYVIAHQSLGALGIGE